MGLQHTSLQAADEIIELMLVTESCLILCDSMDCSPPGSSVHGIFQARMLEWVSRDLHNPGIEPGSPALQADSLPSEPPGKPRVED